MLTKNEEWVLKKARAHVAAGRRAFICTALDEVARQYPAKKNACERMQYFIQLKLQGEMTLGTWQMNNGRGERSRTQLKQDRVRWIDWMLGKI
jgi:hypothetical protein